MNYFLLSYKLINIAQPTAVGFEAIVLGDCIPVVVGIVVVVWGKAVVVFSVVGAGEVVVVVSAVVVGSIVVGS